MNHSVQAGAMRRLGTALRRFRRDDGGVAAIEFAFVVPIMVAMYLGMIELSKGVTISRKTDNLSRNVSDLAAQSGEITNAYLTSLFQSAATVMYPYNATGMRLRLTSVAVNASSEVFVDWSVSNDATGTNFNPGDFAPLTQCSSFTLDPGLVTPRTSYMIAEVKISYTGPYEFVVKAPITLSSRTVMPPRSPAGGGYKVPYRPTGAAGPISECAAKA
jgi:Flp pilus assembly protein TadG